MTENNNQVTRLQELRNRVRNAAQALRGDLPASSPAQLPSLAPLPVPQQPILRTEGTAWLTKSAEEIKAEGENKGVLLERLREVTVPCVSLFSEKLPREIPKKGLLKRVDKDPEPVRWRLTEDTDDMRLTYTNTLVYTASEKGNTLDRVHMEIASSHDPRHVTYERKPSPYLDVKFGNAEVEEIGLHWNQNKPEALLELAKGTVLEEFLRSHFVFNWRAYGKTQGFTIDLRNTQATPAITMIEHFRPGVHILRPTRDIPLAGELSSSYGFRPALNLFTRHFDNEVEHQKWNVSIAHEMSPQTFVSLVQSTLLALVPTFDLNDIK